ncbi:hypothetical protein EUGRSUZ_L01680 [Eucalyptus grandis]|uniref:Uncharacterized protein n=1 Tax=Eucalyptus grandis TaxID=71139 RepID=A0A058ZUN7_EUCGR|nr:hypothetical protein EUGRSUZ_L01680 [Eucalyptus grandis]
MAPHDTVKVLVLVSLLLILDNAYVCLCRNGNPSSICFEEERNALLQLKQSLSDPSHVLSSWNGEDCCRWIGVTCNRANGHVVKLQITSVNENPFLTAEESLLDEYYDYLFQRVFSKAGELNPSLLNLRYLSYLDLSGISFENAHMPKFIGSMKQLRYLDLSYSFDFAIVPHEWGNLTELEVLDLHGCYHAGAVDDFQWLSHLQALKYFDMSGMYVNKSGDLMQGTLPDWLFHLKNLTSLGQLQYLSSLDLSANSLGGTVSEIHFSNLSKLSFLNINNNHLAIEVDSDWIPPFNLWYMGMASCKFGTEFPRWIRTQASLMEIDLSNASISGSLPDWLGLMSLSYLHLSHNQISGSLSKFPTTLFELDLSHNQINSLDLSHNQINSLDLSHNQIKWLDLSHSQINSLDLSHNQINSLDLCNFGSLSYLSLDLSYNQINLLDLSCNQINGSLLKFPFTQLDLSHNLILGRIPQDIGLVMPWLGTLNLNDNLLSGPIPTSICKMEYLYELHLGRNELVGEIPTCWKENLLTLIDLSSNKLYGVIPNSLGNLIELMSLRLTT